VTVLRVPDRPTVGFRSPAFDGLRDFPNPASTNIWAYNTDNMSSTAVRFAYLRPDPKYLYEKPFIFESTTSYDIPTRTNTEKDEYACKVEDVRGQESKFTYAQHGFRYLIHHSKIDQLNIDNHDTLGYANETMELLKNEFNAERVICYDVRVSFLTTVLW
jgi:hypothetical protein